MNKMHWSYWMHRLICTFVICTFVICISHKEIFSWHGIAVYYINMILKTVTIYKSTRANAGWHSLPKSHFAKWKVYIVKNEKGDTPSMSHMWIFSIKEMKITFFTVLYLHNLFVLTGIYCPAIQEWQWRHVLFTKLSRTYNRKVTCVLILSTG